MEVYLPGTGAMKPLAGRHTACALIEEQGRGLLIDCGEGTQVALEKCRRRISRIDRILLTHGHADHILGLPGLLLSMGNAARTQDVEIAGPIGLAPLLYGLLQGWALPFSVHYRELRADRGESWSWNGLELKSLPLSHRCPCLGYRVEQHRRPRFDPQAAEALGLPRPLWGVLQRGESVRHAGRRVRPEEVSGPPRPPRTVTYTTDTRAFAGIAEFAAGSDLFICEGTHGGEEWAPQVEEYGHMLMRSAAQLAAQAQAGRLWITHLSPAEKDAEKYLPALRAVFPQTEIGRDGLHGTV